jgi:hypothetical protein
MTGNMTVHDAADVDHDTDNENHNDTDGDGDDGNGNDGDDVNSLGIVIGCLNVLIPCVITNGTNDKDKDKEKEKEKEKGIDKGKGKCKGDDTGEGKENGMDNGKGKGREGYDSNSISSPTLSTTIASSSGLLQAKMEHAKIQFVTYYNNQLNNNSNCNINNEYTREDANTDSISISTETVNISITELVKVSFNLTILNLNDNHDALFPFKVSNSEFTLDETILQQIFALDLGLGAHGNSHLNIIDPKFMAKPPPPPSSSSSSSSSSWHYYNNTLHQILSKSYLFNISLTECSILSVKVESTDANLDVSNAVLDPHQTDSITTANYGNSSMVSRAVLLFFYT